MLAVLVHNGVGLNRTKLNIGDKNVEEKLKKEFEERYCQRDEGNGILYVSDFASTIIRWIDKNFVPVEAIVRQGEVQPMLLAEIIKQYGEQCPNCNNDGFTLEHDSRDPHENGCSGSCPIQVQCEFCYTNPKSKFNLLTDLENVLKRYENDSKQSA